MNDAVASTQQDTEQLLLALFDAHARVLRSLDDVVDQAEVDSDAKETALEARERASQKIAQTAVDRVGGHLEMLSEREHVHHGRVDVAQEIKENAAEGDTVRFCRIADGEQQLVEGEVVRRYPSGIEVQDPDYDVVGVEWGEITDHNQYHCGVI